MHYCRKLYLEIYFRRKFWTLILVQVKAYTLQNHMAMAFHSPERVLSMPKKKFLPSILNQYKHEDRISHALSVK